MLKSFFSRRKSTAIDELIDAVLSGMEGAEVGSEEYLKLLTVYERLIKVKTEERRNPISWDTIAKIAANLLGILVIVAYEQKHVMNTKALTQVGRI